MAPTHRYPPDIFTEPQGSPDTLAHLGPLRALAGTWEGSSGSDDHPVEQGGEVEAYVERFELVPIDRQTNGPQLFYGLRYHQHITEPGQAETFHDQVGYLLWEPARSRVIMTLAIPRGQVAMAEGFCEPDATTFTLTASSGDAHAGIVTNDFLDQAFHTTAWQITVDVHEDGTWSYEQVTTLRVEGRAQPFAHTDRGRLSRVAPPARNPLAAADEPVR